MASLQLTDRVAVVTGGGSGIGREVTRIFAEAGARVVAADVNEKGAQDTIEGVPAGQALGAHVEVRDRASVDRLMAQAAEWGGRLDILVNCAGIVRAAPSETLSEELWALVLDVNLTGTWRCCQAAFPYLSRGGGAIVNIASVAATLGHPGGGSYGPSKAGVIAVTRALATEWGGHRIRVNAIAPGFIATAMTDAAVRNPAAAEGRRQMVPLGRWGEASDAARLILFLASDAADYITGETITVDGGLSNTRLFNLPGGVAGRGARAE